MRGEDDVPWVIQATTAGLGEVLGVWHGPRRRSLTVVACAGGIVLTTAPDGHVVTAGEWADVTSFRWAKMMHNVHDTGIGRVTTWTEFAVHIVVAGQEADVGFKSATVATWDRDFFMYGANRPDLPDEWTLYRIEDEISAYWLPRLRARFDAGQSVKFGALELSPQGVSYRRDTFPWERVAGAEYKVRNPGPGEKQPGSGTRLHLYVRKPGLRDEDMGDMEPWPEIVIAALEIDYIDALIKLIGEQPTSFRVTSEPA